MVVELAPQEILQAKGVLGLHNGFWSSETDSVESFPEEGFSRRVAQFDNHFRGVEGGVKNIESKMLPMVKQNLMTKLSEKIPQKMEETGGLKVDCTAIEPCDQAVSDIAIIL